MGRRPPAYLIRKGGGWRREQSGDLEADHHHLLFSQRGGAPTYTPFSPLRLCQSPRQSLSAPILIPAPADTRFPQAFLAYIPRASATGPTSSAAMTEYDYSPEAFERYHAKMSKIQDWAQSVPTHNRLVDPFTAATHAPTYVQSAVSSVGPSPSVREKHHTSLRPLHIPDTRDRSPPRSSSYRSSSHRRGHSLAAPPPPVPLGIPPSVDYRKYVQPQPQRARAHSPRSSTAPPNPPVPFPSGAAPSRQVHARAMYPMDRTHQDRTHKVSLGYAPGSTYRVAYEPGREYTLAAPPPGQSYVIVPPNRGRVQIVVSPSPCPFSISDPHWSRTQYAGSRAGLEGTRIGHKRLISQGPSAPPHHSL